MKVRRQGSQPCTKVADYFLLPYPTPHEKRIVESLPCGAFFALRWVPRKSDCGDFLIVTNSLNLAFVGQGEAFAHISYEMKLEDPCESGKLYVDNQWIYGEYDFNEISLSVHLAIYDAIAKEFECES